MELCFDSSLLFSNSNVVIPFASEIRRRVLSEIFGTLDDVKKSQDSQVAQHKILSYSLLLVHLLEIGTVAHIAFKNTAQQLPPSTWASTPSNSHDATSFNFTRLYNEMFKHFNVKGYYNNSTLLQFVSEVLALLFNLGVNLVVRKRQRFNEHLLSDEVLGGTPLRKYLNFCIGQQSINEMNVQLLTSKCVIFKDH